MASPNNPGGVRNHEKPGSDATPDTDTGGTPPAAPASGDDTSQEVPYRDTSAAYYSRRRRRGPARDKVTHALKVSLLDGVEQLAAREGTAIYREIENALERYLKARGIDIPKD